PNDKHAIEAALVLKETNEGSTVHAMSMGSENALSVLREAVAMGCDSASRIDYEEFLPSEGKAEILTKAISKDSYDLILTGMVGDFGSSQIPVLIASKMNFPHITYANTLEVDGNSFAADRYIEGGAIKIKVTMPCIVSVASTANEPRYTSVKRILVAKRTQIPVFSLDDLELDEDSLSNIGGLEFSAIEKPDIEEKEIIKIETDEEENLKLSYLEQNPDAKNSIDECKADIQDWYSNEKLMQFKSKQVTRVMIEQGNTKNAVYSALKLLEEGHQIVKQKRGSWEVKDTPLIDEDEDVKWE
ncbi:hypothetical protein LCGC14_2921970, partial [marine sediment metagenome]